MRDSLGQQPPDVETVATEVKPADRLEGATATPVFYLVKGSSKKGIN